MFTRDHKIRIIIAVRYSKDNRQQRILELCQLSPEDRNNMFVDTLRRLRRPSCKTGLRKNGLISNKPSGG